MFNKKMPKYRIVPSSFHKLDNIIEYVYSVQEKQPQYTYWSTISQHVSLEEAQDCIKYLKEQDNETTN